MLFRIDQNGHIKVPRRRPGPRGDRRRRQTALSLPAEGSSAAHARANSQVTVLSARRGLREGIRWEGCLTELAQLGYGIKSTVLSSEMTTITDFGAIVVW